MSISLSSLFYSQRTDSWAFKVSDLKEKKWVSTNGLKLSAPSLTFMPFWLDKTIVQHINRIQLQSQILFNFIQVPLKDSKSGLW